MIEKIRICNFRSIIDETVELSPLTVLIGRSGTGKSNFIRAVRFLRDFLLKAAEHSASDQPFARVDSVLSYDVTFRIRGIPSSLRYSILIKGNRNNVMAEKFMNGEQVVFHQENGKWVELPPGISAEPPGRQIALGAFPSLSIAVNAFVALTHGIGVYEFPLGVLKKSHDSKDQSLGDQGENFLPTLLALTTNLNDLPAKQRLTALLHQIDPSVSAFELNSITNPSAAIVTHALGNQLFEIPLSNESEGMRRFIAHVVALKQIRTKQTVFFEEPEIGIYPGAFHLLCDEIKQFVEQGLGQIVLTTHSPGLLDNFDVDTLRVVHKAESGTTITRISAEQVESVKEGLLTTGELLAVDPARPELPVEAAP